MELRFNVTGADRKKLVTAIGEIIGCKVKYLGMPSAAYQIGEIVVDKNGTVTGANETLQTQLAERGFTCEHQFEDLNLTFEEELGLGRSHRENLQGETGMSVSDVPEELGLTIGLPRQDFTDTALENLERLIASKASLIKKVVGTDDLALQIDEFTVAFPWFGVECDADKIRAYTHFVTALCAMAKSQSRINSTEKLVENEKYAFRCFLLRLGFIGNDYKAERKILLQNLTGSSAFKGGGKDE